MAVSAQSCINNQGVGDAVITSMAGGRVMTLRCTATRRSSYRIRRTMMDKGLGVRLRWIMTGQTCTHPAGTFTKPRITVIAKSRYLTGIITTRLINMTETTLVSMDTGYCSCCFKTGMAVFTVRAVCCVIPVRDNMTAMVLTGLIGMTGGTGYCGTVCYYSRYCAGRRIVMLTVTTVICMTRITVTELVVMQRDNLAPVADRIMTGGTAAAAGCLVRSSIISYVMTTDLTRMDRMTVKVSGMTIGTGTLRDRCRVGAR